MSILVLFGQVFSYSIRRKISLAKHQEATLFAEDEDEYFFDTFFSPETIGFLLPPKDHWIHLLSQTIVSGGIVGLAVGYLLPWHIDGYICIHFIF
jgi:hypothetical protein